jgi:hypothetical protein
MNKERIISFRATGNEQKVIEILAAHEARTPSEMIRECIREAAEKRGLLPAGLIELERLGLNDGNKTL